MSLRTMPFNVSPIWLLLLVMAFAVFWRLGAGSLAPWDEAIYAQVSKEILQTGDWPTLHWQFQPWFEKPPVFMWITTALFRFFGVSEFWARFPSAVSGVAILALTYSISKSAYGKKVALLAAAILLTCYHFLSFARFGTMEVMLAFFMYLAIYGYVRERNGSAKWWYVVWSACGMAVMVKGAAGVVAAFTIMLAILFERRLSVAIRSRDFWLAILLAIVIVAPWHLMMYVWYGSAFVNEYIGYHVIARSTRALEGNPSGYFYYIAKLIDGFFPWCLMAPFAIVSAAKRRSKDRPPTVVLLLLIAVIFVLYTIVQTRRPWYIVPIYPALAILIAAFVSNCYEAWRTSALKRRLVIGGCAVLIAIGGIYSFISLSLNEKPPAPLAKLARADRSASAVDTDPLILFEGVEPIAAQVALFYSGRPIRQAYLSSAPNNEDARRYVNYEKLDQVVQGTPQRMIMRKDDIQKLAAAYDVRLVTEEGPLAYVIINRK